MTEEAPKHDVLHAPFGVASDDLPERLAVWSHTETVTYRELGQRIKALAAFLRHEMALLPGDRVGISLPKSVDSVTAVLATLQVGGVYVPMDPLSPIQRLVTIATDCQPKVVLCPEDRLVEFGESLNPETTCCVGSNRVRQLMLAAGEGKTESYSLQSVHPDALAAILYTSGSTGVPKGVKLTHRNISVFVRWAVDRFDIGSEDRLANHAPFHFDLSTLDLFGAFYSGAAVFLLDESIKKFPAAITKLIQDHRISIWYSVPTAIKLLCERGAIAKRDLSSLRLMFFAGEVFPISNLKSTVSLFPNVRFVNLYGPTETNVCTYYVIDSDTLDRRNAEIPIGKACEHYEIEIFNDQGLPVQPGERGEICAFGEGVTPGYWSRDSESLKRRINGRPDSYRTGDLGAYDESGNIHFFGRLDNQVKVNGYRVELEEVQSVIRRHHDVSDGAVVLVPSAHSADGQDKLLAYVVLRPEALEVEKNLQVYCGKFLPEYAIPEIRFVDDLPRTSTGKIDYQKLKSRDAKEWNRSITPSVI